jgi:hypothetical protein
VLGDGGFNGRFVCQITLNKNGLRMDRIAMSLVQIVKNNHFFAGLNQPLNGDAANVASTTGNENFHVNLLVSVMSRSDRFAYSKRYSVISKRYSVVTDY